MADDRPVEGGLGASRVSWSRRHPWLAGFAWSVALSPALVFWLVPDHGFVVAAVAVAAAVVPLGAVFALGIKIDRRSADRTP
jgi:hypothetical protein